MPLTPRERLEQRLEHLRTDDDARTQLEARVAQYEGEVRTQLEDKKAKALSSTGMSLKLPSSPGELWEALAVPDMRPISPWREMSGDCTPRETPSGRSTSRRSVRSASAQRRPLSPTLGTARSYSALDTTSIDADGDPVGGWKAMRDPTLHPPFKFGGFESEAARRKQYAESATTALLGPEELPIGSAPIEKDVERNFNMLHSPLPGTLRPMPRIERAHIHGWQPATRQPAWAVQAIRPQPVPSSPTPAPPDAAAARPRAGGRGSRPDCGPFFERGLSADPKRRLLHLSARAKAAAGAVTAASEARAHSRSGVGRPSTATRDAAAHAVQLSIPKRLSEKARRQSAFGEGAAPLSAQQLNRMVAANPGSRVVRKVHDLSPMMITADEARAQRSVISTRIGSAHGGARQRLQWVGRHS